MTRPHRPLTEKQRVLVQRHIEQVRAYLGGGLRHARDAALRDARRRS